MGMEWMKRVRLSTMRFVLCVESSARRMSWYWGRVTVGIWWRETKEEEIKFAVAPLSTKQRTWKPEEVGMVMIKRGWWIDEDDNLEEDGAASTWIEEVDDTAAAVIIS